MAAWSRPASPIAPGIASAQLIYVDAFVPEDGQSLFDINEPGRQPMLDGARRATAGAFRR